MEGFLAWYEARNSRPFHKRKVLDTNCHDDVTLLRQACRVYRREFLQIRNIEVILESLTIASACNKALRRNFLKPCTIGLITTGGYTCNNIYSKKAIMWLLHMEQTYGVAIKHARNGHEYRLPELPHISVDGHCEETNTFYEFYGCYWHGCTGQPFVNSLPQTETHWQPDMNRQWHDWSR